MATRAIVGAGPLPDELATFIGRFGIGWQPWIAFAKETIPSVAILALGSTLLLYLTVTLLLWRDGARWSKSEWLDAFFLSSVGSAFVACLVAVAVSLLGWPTMQILGLSNRAQAAVASTLKVDYVSASCTATAMAITIGVAVLGS